MGGDSHSTTGGAFGCFMTGLGATDMAGVLATGSTWMRVPETLRVGVDGILGDGIAAKDVILFLCHEIGINGAGYMAAEYTGSGAAAMSMDERMVLANMAVVLGAKCGIIAPDDTPVTGWPASASRWMTPTTGRVIRAPRWRGKSPSMAHASHPRWRAPHSPREQRAGGYPYRHRHRPGLHRRLHRREAG